MNTKSDQVEGHAKSAVGIVTGNKDLESDGDKETRKADMEAHVDNAKGKAGEVLDSAKDKLDDVADKAKDALHNK